MAEIAAELWILARQAGPFATLGLMFLLWHQNQYHKEERARWGKSKSIYVDRITSLEDRVEELQDARIDEVREVTKVLEGQNRAQIAVAAAMEARTRTSEILTEAVREMLVRMETGARR